MSVAEPAVKPHAKPSRVQDAASPSHMSGLYRPSKDGQTERDRLRMMMLIRRFEETTFREYTTPKTNADGTKEMKIGGFCHLYSGQEAIAVGCAAVMDQDKGDQLINAYRCHGHSLALGMTPRVAIAELFGKATGCSKGKGGSMHLFDKSVGNNGGHGIVAGHLPVAAGIAFAQWYKKDRRRDVLLLRRRGDQPGHAQRGAEPRQPLQAVGDLGHREQHGGYGHAGRAAFSAETDLAKRGLGYNQPTSQPRRERPRRDDRAVHRVRRPRPCGRGAELHQLPTPSASAATA